MFRRKLQIRKRGHPDYLIIACLAILVVFGLAMLASASSNLGKIRFGDTYYYLKHQIMYGLSFGLVGFFLVSKIYYRRYEKLALVFLLIAIGLLALVFTPLGVDVKGATRWLSFGPITFQPAEIAKLAFIIYLAAWLGKHLERQKSFWQGLVPLLLVIALVTGLLLRQPATSTVVILIAIALIVYFVSGAKLTHIAGVSLLALAVLLMVIYLTPYRWDRIQNFLEPESDLEAGGFHLNQALIAIGSGGTLGVGYGESTTKISYLPEPVGDSIFAVIAEELGFIGSSALIIVFLILILRLFILANRTRDKFGQLLLVGFGSLLALQSFMHIAAISGLVPLTGTPLPFISYGGTALAVFMTMGGIAVNISKYT